MSRPLLDAPLVTDFLSGCDAIARDLVLSTLVQTSERPLVVEIRPIEDRTGANIHTAIYPEMIRDKIIESGCRNIMFRDENAREQVIDERIEQSPESYKVESTRTQVKSLGRRDRPPRPGQLLDDSSWSSTNSLLRTTSVSGKLAEVDYFLNGKIYAQNERAASAGSVGYRYYQFQFRLTDASTGLIPWQKTYRVKREGRIAR